MVRRIPTQVHHQLGRLVRAGVFEERVWQRAVQLNPPIPLPAKSPPPRTSYDLKPATSTIPSNTLQKLRKPRNLPAEVVYLEDKVRQQFFRDHPFEAFRPVTLTEGEEVEDDHSISGKDWTRLRQRGRNPSSEDAVRFAVNLHQYHNMPLTFAYSRAVAQFRSLRSEHFIARRFAAFENESYGMAYEMSEIKLGHLKEMAQMKTWSRQAETDAGEFAARKRWRAIMGNYVAGPSRDWTRGKAYVQQWKSGEKPHYKPQVVEVEYPVEAMPAQSSPGSGSPPIGGPGGGPPTPKASSGSAGSRVSWSKRQPEPIQQQQQQRA